MYKEKANMSTVKKIEIGVLIAVVIWILLFIVNYIRYTDGKGLIFAIHNETEYLDGTVEEYIGLGYTYRLYKRNAIKREEFVPFWVPRENPKAVNALPLPLEDYEVPENPTKKDRYLGLLYYFDERRKPAGTYKCLNSVGRCDKAFGGHDDYDIYNESPITRIEDKVYLQDINYTYAFVDDSKEQDVSYGSPSYDRTIYLYKFLDDEREILAEYSDVKYSEIDRHSKKGIGDFDRYIVRSKDSPKWGLVSISNKGTIKEVLPFAYESINYDPDTGYYVLCKDGKWSIYDLTNKKEIVGGYNDPIYDVWYNANRTLYYKVGKKRSVGASDFVDYTVYRFENGTPRVFLDTDRVTLVEPRSDFLFYLTSSDNKLHFVNYAGIEKEVIQLYFSNLVYDSYSNPAFKLINEKDGVMRFKIYTSPKLGTESFTKVLVTTRWNINKN